MSGIFGVKKISISIHALHEESDLTVDGDTARSNEFQSTLSMRRATPEFGHGFKERLISIHALHEESDPYSATKPFSIMTFQSTLSMRRATTLMAEIVGEGRHFNPRSP